MKVGNNHQCRDHKICRLLGSSIWSARRLSIVLLLALGMTIHALWRGVLAMTLVCMGVLRRVKKTRHHLAKYSVRPLYDNSSFASAIAAAADHDKDEVAPFIDTEIKWIVDWNMKELSAIHMQVHNHDLNFSYHHLFRFFYVGTFLSVFAAHYFTNKFGAKPIISWGMAVGAVATIAFPFLLRTSVQYIFTSALRFVTGLAQGKW